MHLAIFDLDGTLLSGDSDALWCAFLAANGVLDGSQAEASAANAARYAAGTVVPEDYCRFQAGLLAGLSGAELWPLRQRFLAEVIRPCIPDSARSLLQGHRAAGDTLMLTSATNRVVSELTALDLGIEHFLCTELEWRDGVCTGQTVGPLNFRSGKVDRLRAWLADRGLPESVLRSAAFYSDSINDLALLSVVGRPVVVDPDVRLASAATRKGWPVLRLRPPPPRGRLAALRASRPGDSMGGMGGMGGTSTMGGRAEEQACGTIPPYADWAPALSSLAPIR
jgi:HAD superfamily hydrolase (TIGR01490 family)